MPAIKTPKKSTRSLPIRRVRRVKASPVPNESSAPEGGSSASTLASSPAGDGIAPLTGPDTTLRTRLRTPTLPPPFSSDTGATTSNQQAEAHAVAPTTPRGRTSRAVNPPKRFDPSPEAPRVKAKKVSPGGKNGGGGVAPGGDVATWTSAEDGGKIESKPPQKTAPATSAAQGVQGGKKGPARSHKKGMGKAAMEKRRLEALAATAAGGTPTTGEPDGTGAAQQEGFPAEQSGSQSTKVRFATPPPAPPANAKPKRVRAPPPRRSGHAASAATSHDSEPLTYTHMTIGGTVPGQQGAWDANVNGGWVFPNTHAALAMLADVAGMAERLPVFA
ncbi:hypothetical protein IAT38_006219 [Cryptococcus sp. DSM 104549]